MTLRAVPLLGCGSGVGQGSRLESPSSTRLEVPDETGVVLPPPRSLGGDVVTLSPVGKEFRVGSHWLFMTVTPDFL